MKKLDHFCSCENLTLVLVLLLMLVIGEAPANAQGDVIILTKGDSLLSFIVRNKKNKEFFFELGQTIRYKLHTSSRFEKGKLIAIGSDSLSVQRESPGNVTVLIKDLEAVKVPASGGRKFAGGFVVAVAVASFVEAVKATDPQYFAGDITNNFYGSSGVFVVAGIVLTGAGVGLLVSQKNAHRGKSWTFETRKTIHSKNFLVVVKKTGETIRVMPGHMVAVIMKNGDSFHNLKVTSVTQEEIDGNQSIDNRWVKKTLAIRDIAGLSWAIRK